ncbi:MAG: DUF4912 domain-containing protein [Acidobacteria bacterium]|nr:DUF4912 domain-containing protein [Acidobacteriota bacterium]
MAEKTVRTRKKKAVDPFAEVAEASSAPKARPIKVIKKGAAPDTARPVVAKAAVESTGLKAPLAADAFADVAPVSSPVKKRRSVKAKATVDLSTEPKQTKKRVKKTAAAAEVSPDLKPKRARRGTKMAQLPPIVEHAVLEAKTEPSPVFKALADVTLPLLEKEDRARLILQSPTKLYFYWSLRQNPYQLLRDAFGVDVGSYTLVLKLVDLADESETIFPAEPEGNWWFNVEPDREYRAEIGFYAANRPYFRIIYSNTIATPRFSPSMHPASEARWTVSADKFAEVLDVSGFKRDAIDVAIAGDEPGNTADIAHNAFAHFIGGLENRTRGLPVEDIRNTLVSFAEGATLEQIRHSVSPRLYSVLQANAERLTSENASAALNEYYEADESEWAAGRRGAVFGSSLVHFPRRPKERVLRPVSS